jgi:hypothetical protein
MDCNINANGSLSDNLIWYNAYSDTCPGKISNIQSSGTLKKLLDSLTARQKREVVLLGAATDRLILCFSHEILPVAGQVGRVFLQSWYKTYALDECRGTSSGGKTN